LLSQRFQNLQKFKFVLLGNFVVYDNDEINVAFVPRKALKSDGAMEIYANEIVP